MSRLTALTYLNLWHNPNVTTAVLRAASGLTALTKLDLLGCRNVTAAGKQALRTALPNLTIHG